jgi:2Fe-2S ferredoxin
MTTIIFIDHEGNETAVDATDGESVMEAAINNDIEGIVAECGGACACATCHVYVDPAFRALTGEASEMEEAMLDFTDDVTENSRLSCQIEVTEELEGLRVTTPESQI